MAFEKTSGFDPFYHMRTHHLRRPRGAYYDDKRLPLNAVKALSNSGLAGKPCKAALICEIGESPMAWEMSLRTMGFQTLEMVSRPFVRDPQMPPREDELGWRYHASLGIKDARDTLLGDVVFMHVVGTTTLAGAIQFLDSSSIAAVRILTDQTDPAITAALNAMPEEPPERLIGGAPRSKNHRTPDPA